MPESLKNILWMSEELDFSLQPEDKEEAKGVAARFLELAANPTLTHRLY